MNFAISIYNSDGIITRVVQGQEYELLLENVQEEEGFLHGDYPPDQYYVSDGEAMPFPAAPAGDWWIFDTAAGEWIDPRTPDDMWEELLRREAAASLPLYDFLMACRREGLLSDASAAAFPDGVWPPEWEAAIADYTPEQMTDTALKMKTGGIIRRTDGIIQAIATKALQPGQDMNAVFGIIDPYDDP